MENLYSRNGNSFININSKHMTQTQEIIKMLLEQGYIRSSSILLHNIRIKDPRLGNIQIRFFNPKSGSSSLGSIKYTGMDILGEMYTYYFDIERKEIFANFLVNKFYEKNSKPELGLKKAFTRLLHLHGLHWSEEYTGKKKKTKNE